MTVIVCGERRYEVTDEDRLWLLRAVAAEGAVHEQVAQTLVNLFAHLHARKPRLARSLTWLVRNYAQPCNPRWYDDERGDLHRKWLARGKDTRAKARARRTKHSTRTDFPPHVIAAVEKALSLGPVSIPACCTDYAARWIDASKKYHPLTEEQHGVNRLWTRAPQWRGYSVVAGMKSARQ